MVELRQLEYFVATARCLSFSRAAEKCYVSQSTLSEQVAKLEQELKCKLFDRSNRHVHLTSEGEMLWKHIEEVFKSLNRAQESLTEMLSGLAGKVKLGLLPSLALSWVPLVMREFSKNQPQVQFLVKELSSSAVEDQLLNYAIDIAISTLPPKNTTLEYQTLYVEQLCAIVPANHPIAHNTVDSRVNLHHLAGYPFIIYEQGFELRDIILNAFMRSGESPNIVLEVGNTETMKYLVQNEYGVALVPETAIHYPYEASGFRYFRCANPIERVVGVITRKNSVLPKCTELFISALEGVDYQSMINHEDPV